MEDAALTKIASTESVTATSKVWVVFAESVTLKPDTSATIADNVSPVDSSYQTALLAQFLKMVVSPVLLVLQISNSVETPANLPNNTSALVTTKLQTATPALKPQMVNTPVFNAMVNMSYQEMVVFENSIFEIWIIFSLTINNFISFQTIFH